MQNINQDDIVDVGKENEKKKSLLSFLCTKSYSSLRTKLILS